jgi:hypothetical protein
MLRSSLVRLCFTVVVAVIFTVRGSASDVDRLVTLARVWATVKYLHPFLLQKQIDWDASLVRAIPQVRAAASEDAFAEAVGTMLRELGDPATRVIQTTAGQRPAADVTLVRWADDLLVINAGPFADVKGSMALFYEASGLAKQITKAKRVIIDLRHHPDDPDERALFPQVLSRLGGLISEPVTGPASVYVHHSGYQPQDGTTTSGSYFSGLLTVPGETFVPVAGTAAPSRIVFVTDAESVMPSIAVALHAAGKAMIISDAPLAEHVAVDTKVVALGDRSRALIRVKSIGINIAADVIAADPMAEALAIASGAKEAPSTRRQPITASAPEPRWRPDPGYREMTYPELPYRVLAAIRIWSIIEYFYPYKSLIGDWDAALTELLPNFIGAANDSEYASAVLQMVARVEDGHSTAVGHPAVARLLGTWRMPIEVRQVENEFVVTALHVALPADADVRVGDIVVLWTANQFVNALTGCGDTCRLRPRLPVSIAWQEWL